MTVTPATNFRNALAKEHPLQIIGTINAYSAILAEHAGYRAIYLSGSGVATASHGLPDLGITDLHDVLEDARRITSCSSLPLLVDIDTGFGAALNISRTIKEMIKAGVAAVHIEDQVQAKRCGHRPGKEIVATEEMCDRIRVAVDAKTDNSFIIMARTDALISEELSAVIDRTCAYVEAGADMLFIEAVQKLEDYQEFAKATKVPILANITEFGKTPLFTLSELAQVQVSMALYPLSGFRAMSKAALDVYQAIREEGTQKRVLPMMQTREELYKYLNYYQYEQKLDDLFAVEKYRRTK